MRHNNADLWNELERLINDWDRIGDMQSYKTKENFIKDNSPNDAFRDFAYKRIMASWQIIALSNPEARYDALWRLLMYERNHCKSRYLNLDELAAWIAEQWHELLLLRLSMREASYKNRGKCICAVAYRDSLSSKFILCLDIIATEHSLKLLEKMKVKCLNYDKENIEESILGVKSKIDKRKKAALN